MSQNKTKGAVGENLAVEYLQDVKRMVVVDRNVRTSRAEIDIVAMVDNELRFVEVKSRMRGSEDTILSSLDARKLKQLSKGAADYIAVNNFVGVQDIYFDLITVVFDQDGAYEIEYTPSFFYPTW